MLTPLGPLLVQETLLPVGPLHNVITHTFWAPPHVPRPVVLLVLRGLVAQFERDVPIWASKRFRMQPGPVLVREDAFIVKYRRWTRQFYDDDALTMQQALALAHGDASLEW